jgi:hypothetical protein
VPAVPDDVRTQRPLREHRVARDQHIAQPDLTQQRDGLSELVLALADGQLRLAGAVPAGEGAQQVTARQQRLGLGPTHRLAIDGDRLERHGRAELGCQPGPQGRLEGAHIQAPQHPDAGRAPPEAEGGAAPRRVGSTPLGQREQALAAAQHPAAHEGEHDREGMPATGSTPMIRDTGQRGQQRRHHRGDGRRHPPSLPLLASDRKPPSPEESKSPARV